MTMNFLTFYSGWLVIKNHYSVNDNENKLCIYVYYQQNIINIFSSELDIQQNKTWSKEERRLVFFINHKLEIIQRWHLRGNWRKGYETTSQGVTQKVDTSVCELYGIFCFLS